MKIKRFIGGSLESNGYIIYQNINGSCFVIDPGYNFKIFQDYIDSNALKLKGILLTHHHYDHVGAVEKLKDIYDCPVYLHREDCDLYGKSVDCLMEDGDLLDLDGELIKVINTPGHTKGSVCFYSEKSKLAFTGDTIFDIDIGRVDLEGGCEADMIDSILNKVDKWENDITIYPGHGDSCTMKKVREKNDEFLYIIKNFKRS
ncbi:MAG: MBL fold metallo-hydrolase [Anaerovoracaceae bacterium]